MSDFIKKVMCFFGFHNWGKGEIVSVVIQHLVYDIDEGAKIVRQDGERCQFKCEWCGKIKRIKI